MENVLEVKNLQKTFVSRKLKNWHLTKVETKAVNGISFSLKKGEILGLLGPNGAGKTTTIQMLLGTLNPSSGKIIYFGKEFDGEDPEILKRLNFSSTYIRLPWTMTVMECLDVYARLYGVNERKKRIYKLLTRFEIFEFRKKKFSQLSEGQKTRVILAKAFLNYPEVILLDEPTASLDPEIAKKVRDFLLEQQEEYQVSMLFTSHNMKEVQEVCDRIIFLDKGKIVAEDTPKGLISRNKEVKIIMKVIKGQEKLGTYFKKYPGHFQCVKEKLEIVANEEEIAKILYTLSNYGVRYQDLAIVRADLEDFFLEMADKKKEAK